ncbi:uncharacterized protein [Phyllobates terribilis]|uniref:uncharacterized protein n=1 Tax=Phyllobates terribilis TaxID=111132 RepID=UPI003CCAEB4D
MAGMRTISHSSPSSFHSLSRLLLILTLLPLSLAIFAFFLQWRGGFNDPIPPWSPDRFEFPGMQNSGFNEVNRAATSAGDCERTAEDLLARRSSPVFPYFRDWTFNINESTLTPKICVTTSTSAGLEQILPWIFYHKVIGMTNFFLFVEGKAASSSVSRVLQSIPGVEVVFRTKELEEKQAKSRIWNETWLKNFFYKPCNYELFVKQSLNMEMGIVMARNAGMDWIFHLDTDELMYPAGTRDYSLRELLSNISEHVDMVVFPNYESCVERDDVKEPFSEVTLFKKNFDHLPKETYFGHYKEATRGNPNYFLTYGNGKSAARISEHLRPNGAHRWFTYMNTPTEIKLDEAAVLHYTYSKFSDLTSRRDRCGCKPTKEDVKRCFMLEFDRDAFIIASTATRGEMLSWYREHVVWGEMNLKLKLLKKGILSRVYTPMAIIQELRESGVFSSVIKSANEGSSSETQVPKYIKLINGSSKFQVGARKMMEVEEAGLDQLVAVPPLSPPSLECTETS